MIRSVLFSFCLLLIANEISAQDITTTLYEGNGYTLEVPVSWHIDSSEGAIKTDMMALSNSSVTGHSFNTNINVLITPIPNEVSLEDYHDFNVQQIKSMISEEGDLIANTTIKKGEQKYFKLDYRLQFGKNKLRFHQHCAIVDNQAFVFTFTTLDDEWESFSTIAHKIAHSFIVHHKADSDR